MRRAVFDLKDGSRSMQVLAAYLKERAERSGKPATNEELYVDDDDDERTFDDEDVPPSLEEAEEIELDWDDVDDVANAFCKTGKGGGVDPSCGGKGGGDGGEDSKPSKGLLGKVGSLLSGVAQAAWTAAKVSAKVVAKTGEVLVKGVAGIAKRYGNGASMATYIVAHTIFSGVSIATGGGAALLGAAAFGLASIETRKALKRIMLGIEDLPPLKGGRVLAGNEDVDVDALADDVLPFLNEIADAAGVPHPEVDKDKVKELLEKALAGEDLEANCGGPGSGVPGPCPTGRKERVKAARSVIAKVVGPYNLAPMKEVRAALAKIGFEKKVDQDDAIRELRKMGLVTASGLEGRHGVTQEDMDNAIVEGGQVLGFLSMRR